MSIVCYRCHAHYRGFAASAEHKPFELTIHERYRQERLRREQLQRAEENAVPRRCSAWTSPASAQLTSCGSCRERIRDDLKGILKGELLFDDLSRVLYSTDASHLRGPAGRRRRAARRGGRAGLVRYAGEHQVPLVPRGAGTGLAGESLGDGLVVDLSRHFRAILDVGADTVRVQPGVVYRDLAAALARSAGASPPTRPTANAPSAACSPPTLPAPAPSVTATPATTSSACASCSTTATPSRSAGSALAGTPTAPPAGSRTSSRPGRTLLRTARRH